MGHQFAPGNGVEFASIKDGPERDAWVKKIGNYSNNLPGIWGHMLTFLGGPRACIGYRFSLIEMKALLFTLVCIRVRAGGARGGHWEADIDCAAPDRTKRAWLGAPNAASCEVMHFVGVCTE
ncbi:hypothetical protein DFH06DRAFT_1359353 [Mycena polygramma]|nr:hypothetical protein DFH06DRAFT_1359353 [Mycena polygramma]